MALKRNITKYKTGLVERITSKNAPSIAGGQPYAERRQEEEAARRSEQETKRLAQENAVMAEIGRILSSTLRIEEV